MEFCMSVIAQVILEEMKKKEGDSKNVVVSPMSINIILNMVAFGSSGKTFEQFLEFLGSKDINDLNDKSMLMMSLLTSSASSMDDSSTRNDNNPNKRVQRPQEKEPILSLVNALWLDHGARLKPSFQEITKTIYIAQVKNVDLINQADEVKKEVNSWAKEETKGLIKEIVPPNLKLLPPLCLANALYFKGAWEQTFDAFKTRHKKFHLLNGETIKVPFMISRQEFYFYGSFKDFRVLKLQYQEGKCIKNKLFSMYIFLPHERNGLQDLIEKFNTDTTILQPERFHNLRNKEISKLCIPKLKFIYGFDVKKFMKDKGLTLPFQMDADFTNMVDSSRVFINTMLHKACIEVNEEGSEAAAVTFCEMGESCVLARNPPLSFVADYPFMFTIVEEFSQLVVFTGVVLNPLLK